MYFSSWWIPKMWKVDEEWHYWHGGFKGNQDNFLVQTVYRTWTETRSHLVIPFCGRQGLCPNFASWNWWFPYKCWRKACHIISLSTGMLYQRGILHLYALLFGLNRIIFCSNEEYSSSSICLIYFFWGGIMWFLVSQGFTIEDATGLAITGDVDIHSVYATSLSTSHPIFLPQKAIEFSSEWKAPPLPGTPFRLFIGVLSATNHFLERMAVRKTWMQHPSIKSSDVVARFFVALVSSYLLSLL